MFPILITENGIATEDDTERIPTPRKRCKACSRRSPRGSTCAAICTGRCWTTSSGATGSPHSVSSHRPRDVRADPKPSLAWLGQIAQHNAIRAEVPA